MATIRDHPGATIVPPALARSGAHALGLLEQLRGRSPVESAQLVHGEVIGEGGMGIVRAAEQVSLGRTVAVKTLKKRDPAAALDLLREAWVTGTLEHPNVVPVHYVELDADGTPLVVMKRIAGVEWSKLLDSADDVERRFGATDLLAWNLGILMQVLNAIRYAHHRGVIHRDLKPSNVMIGDFGEVYLLDWGIAVSLRPDPSGRLPVASRRRRSRRHAGVHGAGDARPCRQPGAERAHRRLPRRRRALRAHHRHAAAPRPRRHRGGREHHRIAAGSALRDVPAELARICLQALHVDPATRFDSVEAMRLALQHYLEHRGSVELATRAASRLVELEALLAGGGTRDDIYRAFGACRFGFHEALARWHDNVDARANLTRAAVGVAEYELADGQPAAAETVLADVAAPAELTARVAAAKAAHAAELAAAGKLRADLDPDVGRRTRTFLATVFGFAFIALPLVMQFTSFGVNDGLALAAMSAALEVLMVVAYLWARESLTATLFNRRIARTAFFLFGVQIVLGLGMWRIALSSIELSLMLMLSWGLVTGMIAIAIEPRTTLAALGYFVAFAVVLQWPATRFYATSVGNLVMMLCLIVAWRPETWEMTEEERSRFNVQTPRRRLRRALARHMRR